MNQLQRQQSNGQWYDERRADHFVGLAAQTAGCTTAEIQARLDRGEKVRWDPEDWYCWIRNKPAPRTRSAPELRRGQVCQYCGGSEFSGAMFTTDPSSGYCDDCYN